MSPLGSYTLVDTSEVDHARQLISDVYCDHKLTPTGGRRGVDFHARHNHLPIGSLSLNYMSYASEVSIDPGYLKDFYLLQLPVESSRATIHTGDADFLSTSQVASVINPSKRTSMVWHDGCEHLMVQIKKCAVERELCRLSHSAISSPLVFDAEIDLQQNRRMSSWWNMVKFLVSDVDVGSFGYLSEPEKANIETTMIANLLHALPHNYSALLESSSGAVVPRHVKRAEAYMLENIHKPINIVDLVEHTGVSARSLFDAFNRFRNVTPMKRLLQLRLEQAKQALNGAPPGRTVTDILTALGITQMGRFAAHYKKAFGETPSQALKGRN